MNKYVVGYLSLFVNEVYLEIVEAETKLAAALTYLRDSTTWDVDEKMESLEDLKNFCFNGDCAINVIQINDSRSGRSGSGLQNQIAQFDSAASFH